MVSGWGGGGGGGGGGAIPRARVGRGVHRVPRLVEPRAAAAGRLSRGVRAVPGRQAGRDVRDVRRRILARERRGPAAPARGRGGRPRRLHLPPPPCGGAHTAGRGYTGRKAAG